MALAQQSYTSAGVGPYTITFPYLVKAHVEVLVNGALQTQGVAYTFPTASSIQFASSPAAGTITIRRNSSRTARLTNWQDGSKIGEAALDYDANQIFYIAQEALDAAELAVVGGAPASAGTISNTPGNGLIANNVQSALDELQADINLINSGVYIGRQVGANGAANLPSGTTAQRPGGAVAGWTRWNSSTNSLESYDGTTWVAPTTLRASNCVLELGQTIGADFTQTGSTNAIAAGPLTISSGITVTVPSGSNLVVL